MKSIGYILVSICLWGLLSSLSFSNKSLILEESCKENMAEDIANSLKIAIEDDMWFWGEYSSYTMFSNQNLMFEYYYDEKEECAAVLFSKKNVAYQNNDTNSFYCLLLFYKYNEKFTNDLGIDFGYLDYDELKRDYIPYVSGTGCTVIKAGNEPNYNASQEQIEAAIQKIMENFDRTFQTEEMTDIYIRNFYDVSESTVIVYSIDDIQYFANANISGRVFKPTPVTDKVLSDYVQRVAQCSYLVRQ